MALVVEEIAGAGFDIIGYPRLVRLNPSVPWKTRGNAALAVQVGKGAGKKRIVSKVGGKSIYGFERASAKASRKPSRWQVVSCQWSVDRRRGLQAILALPSHVLPNGSTGFRATSGRSRTAARNKAQAIPAPVQCLQSRHENPVLSIHRLAKPALYPALLKNGARKDSTRRKPEPDRKGIFEKVKALVAKHAHLNDENTNPGLVVADKILPESAYWNAVREIVEIEDAKRMLAASAAEFVGYKNGRGLVGASAAIAWPAARKTYEIITYRQKKNIGTQRQIDEQSVIAMDKAHPSTFDNYDYENKAVRIAPNTPCPILFGVRATAPDELPEAAAKVKSEPPERWMLFETNQGSDDHLLRRKAAEVKPMLSSIVSGTVSEAPHEITGGHVFFKIRDETKELECAAYEPTKQFRNVVRQLRPGDEVTVYGSSRDERLTLNLEKLKVEQVAEILEKVENPTCSCKARMHSKGKSEYRCPKCGAKKPKSAAKFRKLERTLAPGWYEVPPVARRHLSRLIKLGLDG
ncbi:MAG: hypothetical protein CVT47_00695 [Thermoplasmata archaeon HGW-Thermoplasmata-2]|nr:MAG: hypothetical protein CVT47_00695 [Thermoplasmata archaeon HGW-Thermoplasmata-2]